MEDAIGRLPYVLNVVVPLLLFMAWIYLGLHILFTRLVSNPASPVLWFFGVVTGPLTRPVRTMLGTSTPESRVRIVALLVYLALWIVARIVLAQPVSPVRV